MTRNWLNSGACVPYDPPPPSDEDCVAEHGQGWMANTMTIGSETYTECVKEFVPDHEEDCENPLGTVTYNGHEQVVCGDDRLQCQNEGGTWGAWGEGDEPTVGCLPNDFGDGLPTCASDGAFVADAESGSFVCESPLDDIPGIPNNDQQEESDIDGDGIPDKDDPDIDGDGIENSQDPDRDGDGVANENDGEPDGPGEEESSVEGGKGCQVAPKCKGDAIQCALLYQTWKNRCESTEQEGTEEIPSDKDEADEILDPNSVSADSYFDGMETSLDEESQELESENPGEVTNEARGVADMFVTGLGTIGGCTPISWDLGPNRGTFAITCDALSDLRRILGYVFYLFTILYLINLAFTPVQAK